jgi:hypothetical protein
VLYEGILNKCLPLKNNKNFILWFHIPMKCLVRSVLCKAKGRGKAITLQAWTGPEGFRRLRLPDFKTFGT